MTQRKFTLVLLSILLCGMALHYTFITIILDDNIIVKFWKEIVILFLFLFTFQNKFRHRQNSKAIINYFELSAIFFVVSLAIAAIIFTENLGTSVYMTRRYLLPFLIYFIASENEYIKKEVIQKLFKNLTILYFITSLWGIFQAHVLKDQFLINLGYPIKYVGRLRDSYYFGSFGNIQRVVSFFANANVHAAILGMILLLMVFAPVLFEKIKNKKIIISLISIAFILTFSRSNWIAISIVLIPYLIKNKKIRSNFLRILSLVVVVSLFYLIVSGNNFFSIFYQYILKTVSLTDDSARGRFGIWNEAFTIFKASPFGIGLGHVGTAADALQSQVSIPSESSYFAILLDTGLQGFLAFIAMIVIYFSYRTANKKIEHQQIIVAVKSILIYVCVIFFFSNHIYDIEITIFLFFMIGLSNNKKFIDSLN